MKTLFFGAPFPLMLTTSWANRRKMSNVIISFAKSLRFKGILKDLKFAHEDHICDSSFVTEIRTNSTDLPAANEDVDLRVLRQPHLHQDNSVCDTAKHGSSASSQGSFQQVAAIHLEAPVQLSSKSCNIHITVQFKVHVRMCKIDTAIFIFIWFHLGQRTVKGTDRDMSLLFWPGLCGRRMGGLGTETYQAMTFGPLDC